MLSSSQRAEIQRRYLVLRAGAPGKPSQVEMDHDAGLPIGKYHRIEKGFAEATPGERVRIAERFGCPVDQVPVFSDFEPAVSTKAS